MGVELELGMEHQLELALALEHIGELVVQRSFPRERELVSEQHAPGRQGMVEDAPLGMGVGRVCQRSARLELALAQSERRDMGEGEALGPGQGKVVQLHMVGGHQRGEELAHQLCG